MADLELPEGSIVNGEIFIVSYFDTDGKMKYGYSSKGSLNIAQVIGLLELTKILVYKDYIGDEPYEPDTLEDEEDDEDE